MDIQIFKQKNLATGELETVKEVTPAKQSASCVGYPLLQRCKSIDSGDGRLSQVRAKSLPGAAPAA